jgi:hypothetical protein
MNDVRIDINVIILAMDSEMTIGSIVLFIKYYLEKQVKIDPIITVIDNHSGDRTSEIARKNGASVVVLDDREEWRKIVKRALHLGRKSNSQTLVILDLTGGNDADDAISLISRSIKEDERFASAYIRPMKGNGAVGCWAIDKGLLGRIDGDVEMDVEKKLVELASNEQLEVFAINEKITLTSKRKRRKMFNLFKRSPLQTLAYIMKYHPLTFYGAVGMGILLTAIGSGFYTIDYFYKHNELNYFPAFLTVALVMIGGFFMVAGLMLNALNVLVERLEAMKKWVE